MLTRSKSLAMLNKKEESGTSVLRRNTRPNRSVPNTSFSGSIGVCTRSKSTSVLSNKTSNYEVDIDFDEARYEWRKNKRNHGNGFFSYK
jgi:hypothetical protein